jgi:hypothetical protein
VENNENAKERVTESDSARKGTSEPGHTCITCDESMDELIAKGQLWCCECCGLLVGTQDKHKDCGFNNKGQVICYLCHSGQCDCFEGEDNTEQQAEEAQRTREYGYSRPSVDDYDPVYDDPNYEEPIE